MIVAGHAYGIVFVFVSADGGARPGGGDVVSLVLGRENVGVLDDKEREKARG